MMQLFEVGLICEIEGGHGELIADQVDLLEVIRRVLIELVAKQIECWTVDFDDDDTYAGCSDYKFCDAYLEASQQAMIEVKAATTIDELRAIKIKKSHLKVVIIERKVDMGGAA